MTTLQFPCSYAPKRIGERQSFLRKTIREALLVACLSLVDPHRADGNRGGPRIPDSGCAWGWEVVADKSRPPQDYRGLVVAGGTSKDVRTEGIEEP